MISLSGNTTHDKFYEYAKHVLSGGYIADAKKQLDNIITDFDAGKSLFVIGNGGAGKTLTFKLLQRITAPKSENHFLYLECNKLVLEFNIHGHSSFLRYNNHNVCFDDLGTEDMGKFYNDTINVMEKFILHRYELFYTKKLKTHFTSNLTMQEVFTRYGLRCADRLKEMCKFYAMGESKNFKSRRTLKNFVGFPLVHHPVIKTKEDIEWEENYKAMKDRAKTEPPPVIKGSGTRLREAIMALLPDSFRDKN